MPTIKVEILEKLIVDIFRAKGVAEEEAGVVAAHLVDAESCGVVSHGVMRVPQYVEAIAKGQTVPGATLKVMTETTATAALDGGHGFGQVMANRAMDKAVELAQRSGVAAVTLVNCSHTGRLGSYTEKAARNGLAAMMMVNAGGHGQWVAPFGGSAGRLATNPISIAVPASDLAPLVLDIATSIAPEGKVRALMTAGQKVPQGWIVDHLGQPTTNPGDLYGPPRGALLPFGGHKGFGLAVLIEALAGGLSGAGCCVDAAAPLAGNTDGVFIIAVNIAAFRPVLDFQQTMVRLVQHLKSSPPQTGGTAATEVLVPGELEARTRLERLSTGIPVEPAVWERLTELSSLRTAR